MPQKSIETLDAPGAQPENDLPDTRQMIEEIHGIAGAGLLLRNSA
ncbi:hypothetical protein [Nocardia speluncae]|nr:hypothetical protein [Nocardia speluncae]